MKLVEILKKKYSEWPEGVHAFCQSAADSEIYATDSDGYQCPAHCFYPNFGFIAEDRGIENEVTKKDWDAFEASQKTVWIRNRGKNRKCPVPDNQRIEVRFRDGVTHVYDYPELLRWYHAKVDRDIMAYRVLHDGVSEQKSVIQHTCVEEDQVIVDSPFDAVKTVQKIREAEEQIRVFEKNIEDTKKLILFMKDELAEHDLMMVEKSPEIIVETVINREYKIGDIVEIITENQNQPHFAKGTEVRLLSKTQTTDMWRAEYLSGYDWWYVRPDIDFKFLREGS